MVLGAPPHPRPARRIAVPSPTSQRVPPRSTASSYPAATQQLPSRRARASRPLDRCLMRLHTRPALLLQLWSPVFASWFIPAAAQAYMHHGSRVRLRGTAAAAAPEQAGGGRGVSPLPADDAWELAAAAAGSASGHHRLPPALQQAQLVAASPARQASQQRRQMLAAASAGQAAKSSSSSAAAGAAAAAAVAQEGVPPNPYANSTAGDPVAVSTAETALREALLKGYDANTFPWVEMGRANVTFSMALHKILEVGGCGTRQSAPPPAWAAAGQPLPRGGCAPAWAAAG